MTKCSRQVTAAICFIAIGLLGSTALKAQEGSVELAAITCKDVMRSSGAERDLTIAFMHGYVLAQASSKSFEPAKLEAATDQFLDACLDKPSMSAVEALAAVLK